MKTSSMKNGTLPDVTHPHRAGPAKDGKLWPTSARLQKFAAFLLFSATLSSIAATESSAEWIELFNGRDLTGWRENRFAHQPRWEVKDGVLIGQGGQGYLATEREFTDLVLVAEVRIFDTGHARGNSGVYFRCQPHRDLSQEYLPGYEAQCDHLDRNNPTGSIYNLGVPSARAPMPGVKDGEWFTLRVIAQGDHLRTWVNGQLGADCHDPQNRYRRGYILLQMHHRTGVVEFRKVRVRELSSLRASSPAATESPAPTR
jgi:hypothetical protein